MTKPQRTVAGVLLLVVVITACAMLTACSDYPGGWKHEPQAGVVTFPNAVFAQGVPAPFDTRKSLVYPLPSSVDDRKAFERIGETVFRAYGYGDHDLGDGHVLSILPADQARAQATAAKGDPAAGLKGQWAFGNFAVYENGSTRTIIPGPGDPGVDVPRNWSAYYVAGHEIVHLTTYRMDPSTLGEWHAEHWSEL